MPNSCKAFSLFYRTGQTSEDYKEVFIVGSLVSYHGGEVTEEDRVEGDAINHPEDADY